MVLLLEDGCSERARSGLQPEDVQDGGVDIPQMQPVLRPGRLAGSVVEYEDPLLGVIGLVWTGVVFEGVRASVAQRANAAPAQPAKDDNEVRSHAVARLVDLLGLQ